MSLIGHGSKFQLGDGATPTEHFTDTLGCLSIDFSSDKVDSIDNTHMGTSGNARTFEGGLEDYGDVTAKFNVLPGDATQTALYTAKDGLAHNFKVIYPGAVRTRSFSGIILSIDEQIPDDKKPTLSVKVKVSGTIVNS